MVPWYFLLALFVPEQDGQKINIFKGHHHMVGIGRLKGYGDDFPMKTNYGKYGYE